MSVDALLNVWLASPGEINFAHLLDMDTSAMGDDS